MRAACATISFSMSSAEWCTNAERMYSSGKDRNVRISLRLTPLCSDSRAALDRTRTTASRRPSCRESTGETIRDRVEPGGAFGSPSTVSSKPLRGSLQSWMRVTGLQPGSNASTARWAHATATPLPVLSAHLQSGSDARHSKSSAHVSPPECFSTVRREKDCRRTRVTTEPLSLWPMGTSCAVPPALMPTGPPSPVSAKRTSALCASRALASSQLMSASSCAREAVAAPLSATLASSVSRRRS
mmetsp:Transcript_6284/g.18243  ORF Transcript_6284/g.18243 Transcript_6284/m.18243 type:complete len:243 (-) Transcript_6284:434-1162(-)